MIQQAPQRSLPPHFRFVVPPAYKAPPPPAEAATPAPLPEEVAKQAPPPPVVALPAQPSSPPSAEPLLRHHHSRNHLYVVDNLQCSSLPKTQNLAAKFYPKLFSLQAIIFLSQVSSEISFPKNKIVIRAASSAAGSSNPDSDLNPYEILGVSPIEGFEKVKQVYTRKRKEADKRGDEATAALLEKAYDKLMMAQLVNRKKGVTYGLFKVSKDVKYADKQPIIPWGPRFAKSSVQDMRINLAISAVFTAWILIMRNVEYKPLQFLAFAFVYRIFEKLKVFEPPVSPTFTEEGEDDGRGIRMGKRLLRSLALVFGSIALASLAYTGLLNLIEYIGGYIPIFLYNNQELIVTTASAVSLYIMASYYR
ncbi:RNA recognition motif-containing family protein [Hibiscus syriacus]|uniref:RNA recognition motif-containing family protein n=1 Tax=Hibiscus syriacus TaxID=106335 RepID=A0A6A3BS12_HIBSY|nr:RNA recognition motif-containing family protein [Hibiscus syriacus]